MDAQPPKHSTRRKSPQPGRAKAGGAAAKPPLNPASRQPSSSQLKISNPPTVLTEERPEIPTNPPPTSTTLTVEADQKQIVREFLQKFGRGTKVSAIYARLVEVCRDEETTMTPSQMTSPQPLLRDTPTTHPVSPDKGDTQ